MDVDFLPEHLIVVGGSYIGLEFAQMYRRFGSEVTVVEMGPRLIAREDEDVSAAIKEMLEAEGIAVRLKAECVAVSRRGGGIGVHVSCEEEPREIVGSHLLIAVGRVPNTGDLGLDRAGVAHRRGGYIDGRRRVSRTNVPGIWALGDVNGRGAFTHTVVQRLRDRRRQPARRRATARQRSHPGVRAVRRSAARARRDDRARRPRVGPSGARRQDDDGARRTRTRARRDAGLHAGAGRRRIEEDPRRGTARHRGRRSDPLHHRRDERRRALHGRSPAPSTSIRPCPS